MSFVCIINVVNVIIVFVVNKFMIIWLKLLFFLFIDNSVFCLNVYCINFMWVYSELVVNVCFIKVDLLKFLILLFFFKFNIWLLELIFKDVI